MLKAHRDAQEEDENEHGRGTEGTIVSLLRGNRGGACRLDPDAW